MAKQTRPAQTRGARTKGEPVRAGRSDVRIGTGEFRDPAEPIPAAQWMFLDAVQRLIPDVLVELTLLAEEAPDETRLRAWARTRGFSDRWLVRHARLTVELWREQPDTRWKFWRFPTSAWLPETVVFASPEWDARAETEEDYQKRVDRYKQQVASAEYGRGAELTPKKRTRAETKEDYQKRVEDYRKEVAAAEDGRGGKLTPTKKSQPDEQVERHFEWLALYVVGGWSLAEICKKHKAAFGLAPQAVRLGVHAAAALAGVTLKPSKSETQS